MRAASTSQVPGNFLTGPLPAFLVAAWPHLRVLALSDNAFTGRLPVGALMQCRGLARLEVARNAALAGALPLPFLHATVARLAAADFAGTLLAAQVGERGGESRAFVCRVRVCAPAASFRPTSQFWDVSFLFFCGRGRALSLTAVTLVL